MANLLSDFITIDYVQNKCVYVVDTRRSIGAVVYSYLGENRKVLSRGSKAAAYYYLLRQLPRTRGSIYVVDDDYHSNITRAVKKIGRLLGQEFLVRSTILETRMQPVIEIRIKD